MVNKYYSQKKKRHKYIDFKLAKSFNTVTNEFVFLLINIGNFLMVYVYICLYFLFLPKWRFYFKFCRKLEVESSM